MRARVNRRVAFDWARPEIREVRGERLRRAVYGRSLSGAAYPLPASERRRDGGIRSEGGLTLILPADPGLRPGDLLRRSGTLSPVYRVAEVRVWPAHVEALLRITPVTAEGEPYDD